VFAVFRGVASEIDELPLGQERERWLPAALEAKDRRRAEYLERCREEIVSASKRLLEVF
jgi:hypothetical protein